MKRFFSKKGRARLLVVQVNNKELTLSLRECTQTRRVATISLTSTLNSEIERNREIQKAKIKKKPEKKKKSRMFRSAFQFDTVK